MSFQIYFLLGYSKVMCDVFCCDFKMWFISTKVFVEFVLAVWSPKSQSCDESFMRRLTTATGLFYSEGIGAKPLE